jgi:uncharacterized membrane protein
MSFFQYALLVIGIITILTGIGVLYLLKDITWYLSRILQCLDASREISCRTRDYARDIYEALKGRQDKNG